jgi:hypothetical protein
MLGIVCIGVSFVFAAVASLLVYVQGGSISTLATEFGLLVTLSAALGGVGFIALGLGAIVFSLNYEPIRQEARLVGLSAIPYGFFLLAMYFARLRVSGLNDLFEYGVQRDASGTPTLIFAMPESYATLGPFILLGTVAFTILCVGLAHFLNNMKIVKDVGNWTINLTRALGWMALVGQGLLLYGWSTFSPEAATGDAYSASLGAYLTGYFVTAFFVPLLGAVVAFRVGAVFWDAAKTVRYLSDFRKRAQTSSAARAKHTTDDRKWWERIADDNEKQ